MSGSKFPIPEAALTQHIAVLGKTGSGKTSTAKLIVEHVVARASRVCILDPTKSDWWGMISSADGKRAGLPFTILGGPHGHVPLHAGAGAAIAELVASGALPLSIIDMSDFPPGGVAKFYAAFAPVLLRKMKGVLYLVKEEAHEFAPKERSGIGEENFALHYAKKIATAGRSKGIRMIACSQRVQALHNAVLGSCDTVVVHRMTAPADQEPVAKWLKGNVKDKGLRQQIEESLPNLKTGTGWVCSGEAGMLELVAFPRIHTFDNSATPDDDSAAAAVVSAKVDQEKLRALVGDAVKDAEASDPALLKKRIAELERQLKANVRAAPIDTAALEEARAAIRRDAEIIKRSQGVIVIARQTLTDIMSWNEKHAGAVANLIRATEANFDAATRTGARPENPERRVEGSRPAPSLPRSQRQIDGRASANGALPKGEAATLAACIQFPDGLRREQLTVLTGYKRSSRDAYIQRLREKGYVEARGDLVLATVEGLAALPDAEPLPTGKDLQDYWLQRLPEGERKILGVLIELHGEPIARAALDEMTGYQRSSRDAYLQRLRAKQLVIDEGRSQVRATENLFT
jgi:hypothetical protein